MKVQFVVLLLARILASGLQALAVVFLARWVGTETFGSVSIIMGVGTVPFTLADWGLSSYIPRARAKGHNHEVATGLRMNLAGNLAAGALFTVVLAVLAAVPDVPPWLCALPLACAVDQFTEAGLTVPVADRSKATVVVSILLRRALALGAFVGLYLLGVEALQAYASGLLASAAAGWLHIHRVLKRRVGRVPDRAGARAMYKALAPVLVANLSTASRTLDSAIVGAVTSVHAAGLYSAASKVTRPLMLVGSSAVAVVLPHAARQPLHVAKHLGRRLTAAALLFSIPLVPVILLAEPIVTFLFGPEYADAAPAFAWAAAAMPFLSLSPPLGGILQSQGFQAFVARNGMVFAVLTLALVWAGAVAWGAGGAAAGITVAYVLKSAALFVRLQRAEAPLAAPAGPGHQEAAAAR
ncbi:oligosaccharide flippase family protein [Arthrobacter deserti]|uniref:Oligosaccharide flippase family protein n=1 Tax=Arthrobacter deserti TaxID=1742687 RepID=A0ABX1JPU2_9MICC|nr:oligosaccharide flippase family protein [Arthrobacter deserti]